MFNHSRRVDAWLGWLTLQSGNQYNRDANSLTALAVAAVVPPRSTAGQLTLDQHIGVRIPGGQPITFRYVLSFPRLPETPKIHCNVSYPLGASAGGHNRGHSFERAGSSPKPPLRPRGLRVPIQAPAYPRPLPECDAEIAVGAIAAGRDFTNFVRRSPIGAMLGV